MAFKKIATLQLKQIYASDNKGNFGWRNFVKEANKVLNTNSDFLPKEAYEYDTKNFVYIKARAISGMEKWGANGNGDAFPWEELKKSYPSFIAKGFYIEHKEDDEKDAKGIILDAEPDDENQFIICLCAVDKNEYPEICKDIIDGKLNQVSMSCFPAGTKITMADGGTKNIEDIEKGEMVLTHTGNIKPVVEKMERNFNGNLIKLNLKGISKEIMMTPEHPVLVKRKKCACGCGESVFDYTLGKRTKKFIKGHHTKYINILNGRIKNSKKQKEELLKNFYVYEWVLAKDLKPFDIVLFPIKKKEKEIKFSTNIATLFGYFIAEGSFIKRKNNLTGIDLCFDENEKDTLVKRTNELFKTEFGIEPKNYLYSNHCYHVRVINKEIAQLFFENCGEYANGKHLPKNIFEWNAEAQLSLLGAYLEGDGCFMKNKNVSATVSQKLSEQLTILCTQLKLNFSQYKVKSKIKKDGILRQNAYYLTINSESFEKLQNYCKKVGLYGNKNKNSWYDENYYCRHIQKIEEVPFNGTVYNFEVKDDNSYVAENVTVHNCLANECECSLCHNVAHSQEELCQHQNPKSPLTYCKNSKDENGNTIYEINRNIVFTGLSGVAVPADKDAFISEIRASKKSSVEEELNKYNKAKAKHIEAGKMKELKACVDELLTLPVNKCLEELSTDISSVIQDLLANEQDHPNCNKISLDMSLQTLAKVKFALNALAEEIVEDAVEETVIDNTPETAVVETAIVTPLPDEEKIGEKVELEATKTVKKASNKKRTGWFKLK